MSIDARGKIANAMVFMGWKGVKTVRMWLKPKNPDTIAQQTQRGYFRTAVSKHHLLLGADKAAWDLRCAGQAISGFNLFVKKVCDCLFVPLVWGLLSTIVKGTVTTTTAAITGVSDNASLLKIKYGLAVGVYPSEADETGTRVAPGAFAFALTGLTKEKTYYYTIEGQSSASVISECGVYSFTTPAA
jgi:hypothetical protein